jgi:hypothetical protein
MSKEELQAVLNFKIENNHGSIEFFGNTDITELDLAKIVLITAKSVDVYPKGTEHLKPKLGNKLNKPAVV